MSANRYDQAAEAPILNTYVPINFGELYRIGVTQKAAVEDAAKQFGTALQKFGEFQSPSAIDTQTWYNNTIGREDIQNVINSMVSNPDWMKDSANRATLQSILNSVDYATLSNLKQSREGLLARQKANQQLMLSGKYNPYWHDVDFTNYDTTKSGTFNDVSPLAYKSEVDLVRPYVDNLKASWIRDEGFDRWKGVTAKRTMEEVDNNISSIRNTPEYAKHVQSYMKRYNLSEKDARDMLDTTLYTAAREFAWELPETNTAALQTYLARMKYDQNQRAGQPTRITVLQEEAAAKMDNYKRNMVNNYISQSGKGLSELTPEDWTKINGAIYNSMANGIPEEVKGTLTPTEYFNYKEYTPIKIKPADKKAASLPNDNAEKYQYELGDMLLTQKGAIARDIPAGVFTVESGTSIPTMMSPTVGAGMSIKSAPVNVYYDPKIIETALATISSDGVFAPNNKTFSYSNGEQNILMKEGSLIIPKKRFKQVIEQIIDSEPDIYKGISARKYMNILTGGYGSTDRTMKLINELKGKYDIDGVEYSDLIEIKMARPVGISSSYNQTHNLGFNKEYQGTKINQELYSDVLGQSVEEATAGFNSNF